jgi:iron complex outermembrane receptor protein
VRWDIVPKLELATGLRWSDETRTEAPVNADGAPIPVLQDRVHANNVSPEITLTYRPTDDLTAFAAWKKGFKSGSFTLATPPTPNSNNAFNEETVRGAEMGLKSRWFDRHLTANLAAYLYNYSGLQVGAIEPTPAGIPHIVTENAGAARTYGIDFDAAYRPPEFERLTVNAALDWNHARYLDLVNVPCWGGQTIAEGCDQFFNKVTGLYTAQNLSGTPMIRAPAWQAQLGPSYEFSLGRGYRLELTNNNNFQTRYVAFLAVGRPNNDQYQGSFIKSDLSLSLVAPNDSWEVTLLGKNIGDKITAGSCSASDYGAGIFYQGLITGGTTSGPAGPDQVACYVDPGREIWLRFTVKPGAPRQ